MSYDPESPPVGGSSGWEYWNTARDDTREATPEAGVLPVSPETISDAEFRERLLQTGRDIQLPEGWLNTWANQLVRTVPTEIRGPFLRNEIKPQSLVSDLSDEEIARGL